MEKDELRVLRFINSDWPVYLEALVVDKNWFSYELCVNPRRAMLFNREQYKRLKAFFSSFADGVFPFICMFAVSDLGLEIEV